MEAKIVNAKDREIFLQNNLSKVSENVLNTFSKFCGKTVSAEFWANRRNYAEIVPFRKISALGN